MPCTHIGKGDACTLAISEEKFIQLHHIMVCEERILIVEAT
jgi:pyrimidine deaminase RibD-like protein